MARSGYTLPVFATASAVAALRILQKEIAEKEVEIDLLNPPERVIIPVEQVARIGDNQALAITRSDPGDNLDLTRNTPVWALVTLVPNSEKKILIQGGEGVGRIIACNNKPAIYSYAKNLLEINLLAYLEDNAQVEVKIILPEGKKLAERTSNAAFGVVEGLSLLGTSGISQPLSSPEQLELYLEELTSKSKNFEHLVFCIGENGLDLAAKIGFNPAQLVKTANWLGPMLVKAGELGLKSILLFGYHGKLIKLAGNVFQTHHFVADARLEILTSLACFVGVPQEVCRQIFIAETVESGLAILRNFDAINGTKYQDTVYHLMANRIEENSRNYIKKHIDISVYVGAILFARNREIIVKGETAESILSYYL
ncbi:MAG: cobalt-precorrin-5B (C(1))-methyltransferase CbiD [Geminocystis sp.]|nr:cobalt-precorrin-5B (C(1))-methyltransferase CbiD [Geminocystis sp.]HIK38097.1 cobalt-precorrin-5B (C(1))-methyltransferase [Geminocystis sp. M7585_C2015_104]MCS7149045.1 cobalt-precorrin-5B (C(1))-methyltransferase CbiD [Geminocystis sp.]MCX8077754.1 cobalt-precorrin-5B (C(1))-methyltransferase CbiD [Geminocystis sp.]MDW8117122.1 cobalt-precorrin-5B (C(1))-methyltransferase CbiD [Geminocystis sp.]